MLCFVAVPFQATKSSDIFEKEWTPSVDIIAYSFLELLQNLTNQPFLDHSWIKFSYCNGELKHQKMYLYLQSEIYMIH
jgi:hypothetical protein